MTMRRVTAAIIAGAVTLFLTMPAYASKPDIFRYALYFDFGPIVDCGTFEVWTRGWERDTEKWWYDETGTPVRLQFSINVTESEYYNKSSDKFVTQGKKGVGENITIDYDIIGFDPAIGLIFGDSHEAGAAFRLTIPGIGHVLLNVGTWFWDESEQMLIHNGPDFALAEGETGLALCEALE